MDQQQLRELLELVASGGADVEHALSRLSDAGPVTMATSESRVDLDRQRRCGWPEVVYCPGKTAEEVVAIFRVLQDHRQSCLGTRATVEQAAAVQAAFPEAEYSQVARTLRLMQPGGEERGHVCVVSAGTSDRPVAEEAVETLRWMQCSVDLVTDVGVAGPRRLLEQRDRLTTADAVVVVAGMEGALPSAVGGWVSCPVIAVPTSVGYGASFGGVAALLGMLNSCASNVTVVNIDAGFKGGYIAGLIARPEGSAPAV